MIPALIGIGSGLFVILLFHGLREFDKLLVYGLILTGIGFIYVGFSWTVLQALVVNSVQAVFFLALSFLGIRKSVYFLAAGYFLHGTWDLVYAPFAPPALIPPGYDLFCLSIDFAMGLYLLWYVRRNTNRIKRSSKSTKLSL
jgi:hypothetical protein